MIENADVFFYENISRANKKIKLPGHLEYYATNLLSSYVSKPIGKECFSLLLNHTKNYKEYAEIGDKTLISLCFFENSLYIKDADYYRKIGSFSYNRAYELGPNNNIFNEISNNYKQIENLIKKAKDFFRLDIVN